MLAAILAGGLCIESIEVLVVPIGSRPLRRRKTAINLAPAASVNETSFYFWVPWAPLLASPTWRPGHEEEVIKMKQIPLILLAAIAGLAWLRFAEHPSAKNLRTAIADTLPLA